MPLSQLLVKVKDDQSWLTLCNGLENSLGQNTGVGAFPFSRGSSHPRDGTQVSHMCAGSLPAELPGKRLAVLMVMK